MAVRVHVRGTSNENRIFGTYDFAVFLDLSADPVETGTGSFREHRIRA